jgi:transcription factor Sp3
MGQGGSITLPNLQTVTVNSIGQPGIQYTQGEEAGSPACRNMHTYTHTYIHTNPIFLFLTLSLSHTHTQLSLPTGIQIKEEPDSEEWQLSGDSTLNPSDINNLRVQMDDEDMDMSTGEGKRLRRVACTCPNCKEAGGRWVGKTHINNILTQMYIKNVGS